MSRERIIPIGVRMRALREAKGRSVASVARAIHVSKPTIYQWETGARLPALDRLDAYLREIGESLTIGVPS